MERPISQEERKELQKKLTRTLKGQIDHLSREFQQMLTDDLITALENRLAVFRRVQASEERANLKTYFESINHLYIPQQKQG